MPKVYEYFGLIFFFYSNDHEPVHLHVRYQDTESKLVFVNNRNELLIETHVVKGKKSLSKKHLQAASNLAFSKRTEIFRIWEDFFIHGRKIKCEKITEKFI